MDVESSFMQVLQNIGFRNMLLIFSGAGVAMLLWLTFSLPGGPLFKSLVRLFLLAGIILLIVIIPLRLRTVMPAFAIRLICFAISVTILLILLQFARLFLLLPSLVIAPVWNGPLHIVISRWLSLAVVVAGFGLGGLAFWNTIRVPDVRKISIPVADLPSGLENFHIVQLTDMHLGTIFDEEWSRSVVERANALDADIIAVTGDTGEFAPSLILAPLAPLKDLKARQGVFYSLGNHETYQGVDEWAEWYENAGTFLRNSHSLVSRNGATLAVIGLDDIDPDMDAATRGIPPQAVPLVMAHRPSFAPMIAAYDAPLQLAGHTHGGLIPGLRNIVARTNKNFVSGLYQVGKMTLYVSNGTGLWTYMALRLNNPSEITSIRLVRAQ